MEFKLHTYDIQLLDIALICYQSMRNDTLTDKDRERLSNMLAKLNNLCTKDNDYTLKITVE